MILTFQQVEPISNEHHDKIIAAFNKLFINKGGKEDGYGDGYSGPGLLDGCYGTGRGGGFGDGGSSYVPEEWRVE